jgi:hypothetical protein
MKMERPLPEEVAGEQETTAIAIPEGQREVADQPANRLLLPALHGEHRERGIGQRRQPVGPDAERRAELAAIVEPDVRAHRPAPAAPRHRGGLEPVLRQNVPRPLAQDDVAERRNDGRLAAVATLRVEHEAAACEGLVAAPVRPESRQRRHGSKPRG